MTMLNLFSRIGKGAEWSGHSWAFAAKDCPEGFPPQILRGFQEDADADLNDLSEFFDDLILLSRTWWA